MREIVATTRIVIPLGKQGENQATVVKFPVDGWDTLYGAGAFELLNVRPSENTPYTCSITVDDQFARWVVQAADVALVGHGKCELTYVVDGTVAKSLEFATCVLESIEGSGTVPPPYESRIHDLIEASANVTTEANRAEAAAESAQESASIASESAQFVDDVAKMFDSMTQATEDDVGKALKVKIVKDGRVTEWEFGENGSSVSDLKSLLHIYLIPILKAAVYTSDQSDEIISFDEALQEGEIQAEFENGVLMFTGFTSAPRWSVI